MIPINLMPFITAYWPYFMGILFVYTLVYLSFDRSRVEAERERHREIQRRKEVEKEDRGDSGEVDFEEDAVTPAIKPEETEHAPLKMDTFSEVG